MVVSLVHTSLGSSYLIAHVLHSPPPPRAQLCKRSCSNKHTHTHLSPQPFAVMARRRRRRPPGGQTTAAGSGRRRAPFSTDNLSHTHTARSLACPLLTLSSPARSFPNGIFRYDGAPCGRPLLPCSDRSAGQRNQPSHSTVLARPVRLFVCVSAASFPCARPLLPSSDRSAGQRNQPSLSTVLARPVCLFVCVSAASFPCRFLDLGLTFLLASACCTRARLSFPAVYVSVVECASSHGNRSTVINTPTPPQ